MALTQQSPLKFSFGLLKTLRTASNSQEQTSVIKKFFEAEQVH